MAFRAAVGQSRDVDSRAAGVQAAQYAMDQLGRGRAVFGWLAALHTYSIQDVLAGVNDVLGNVPMLGFSTSGGLVADGHTRRSVVLALVSSEDVAASAGWWPDYVQDSQACAERYNHL